MKLKIESENVTINLDRALCVYLDPETGRLAITMVMFPPQPTRPDAPVEPVDVMLQKTRVTFQLWGKDAASVWEEYNKDALVVRGGRADA